MWAGRRGRRPLRCLYESGRPMVAPTINAPMVSKRKAANVGNMPGVTKAQQWIKIKNDFELLESEINKLDNNCFVKLLRISGVYYDGDANNEMIDRITGKAFESREELDKFLILSICN